MLTYDWVYSVETYLNNLMMFKLVHDEGIDVSVFNNCELASYNSYYISDDCGFNCFTVIVEHLFETVHCYPSEYEDGPREDKMYWVRLSDCEEKLTKSTAVIVILDDSLQNPVTGIVGESDYSGSHAEIFKIKGGIVMLYDLDYGDIDYTSTMEALLKSKRLSNIERNERNHEVAI